MRWLIIGLWLLTSSSGSVRACLWDRDTVAHEASGIPEILDVIVGRFERNPPLYYKMRLSRLEGVLKREPTNLDAYDDAAVACDRLGDDDRAILLMEEKARQLAVTTSTTKGEQIYRLEANIGTFYVHRWIRHGRHRDAMQDLDQAHGHISTAIQINPKAHFGRERYQLMAIDWIRNPEDGTKDERSAKLSNLPTSESFLDPHWSRESKSGESSKEDQWNMAAFTGFGSGNDMLVEAHFEDANKGLSGLIVLGNAWESIDVYNALGIALNLENKATLSHFVRLRIDELIDDGATPFFYHGHSKSEMKENFAYLGAMVSKDRYDVLAELYKSLRSSAEKWQRNRTAFMEGRLRQGLHPDTDPQFWDGYHEIPRPPLTTLRSFRDPIYFGIFWTYAVDLIFLGPLAFFVGYLIFKIIRSVAMLRRGSNTVLDGKATTSSKPNRQ